jgi:hypothetical protein
MKIEISSKIQWSTIWKDVASFPEIFHISIQYSNLSMHRLNYICDPTIGFVNINNSSNEKLSQE